MPRGFTKLADDHDDLPEAINVNDDLARELAFYTQALDGTRQAFRKMQSVGLPFLRPPDYYTEMVRADPHMPKVKGRILSDKKMIEESEERKKAREAKKIAKEVRAQKAEEWAKRKKEELESVEKWQKRRQQSGFLPGGRAMMRWIWVLTRRRDSRNRIRGGPGWLPAIDPEGREARRRIRRVGSAETRSLGTEVGKVWGGSRIPPTQRTI